MQDVVIFQCLGVHLRHRQVGVGGKTVFHACLGSGKTGREGAVGRFQPGLVAGRGEGVVIADGRYGSQSREGGHFPFVLRGGYLKRSPGRFYGGEEGDLVRGAPADAVIGPQRCFNKGFRVGRKSNGNQFRHFCRNLPAAGKQCSQGNNQILLHSRKPS